MRILEETYPVDELEVIVIAPDVKHGFVLYIWNNACFHNINIGSRYFLLQQCDKSLLFLDFRKMLNLTRFQETFFMSMLS